MQLCFRPSHLTVQTNPRVLFFFTWKWDIFQFWRVRQKGFVHVDHHNNIVYLHDCSSKLFRTGRICLCSDFFLIMHRFVLSSDIKWQTNPLFRSTASRSESWRFSSVWRLLRLELMHQFLDSCLTRRRIPFKRGRWEQLRRRQRGFPRRRKTSFPRQLCCAIKIDENAKMESRRAR